MPAVAAEILSDVLGIEVAEEQLRSEPSYRNAFLGLVGSNEREDTLLLGRPEGVAAVQLPRSYGRQLAAYARDLERLSSRETDWEMLAAPGEPEDPDEPPGPD
ncbi:MAG TPA: hypothetical protein VMN39_01505 [Longimicrobiaceae bacterium]|nr:hypothetical protein [Longimicrobiaceae bacterium]